MLAVLVKTLISESCSFHKYEFLINLYDNLICTECKLIHYYQMVQ